MGQLTINILEHIAIALAGFAQKVDSAIESSFVSNFDITQLSGSNQNFGNKTYLLLSFGLKINSHLFIDLTILVHHTFNLFQKFSGDLNVLIVAIKAVAIFVPGLKLL